MAVVPNATPGSTHPVRYIYGDVVGNCASGYNAGDIDPEESATWRSLLEGNFHFTRPGTIGYSSDMASRMTP